MSAPEVARLALLVLHFIGLAGLIGPFLVQLRREKPSVGLMLGGAAMQVLSGNALIAANQLQGLPVDEMKMIIKLGLAVVALGLLVAARLAQRREQGSPTLVRTLARSAGLFGVANIVIAVVWT